MEITLRKASALSSALIEKARALSLSKTVTISIYSNRSVAQEVEVASSKLSENIKKATALFRVAYEIRDQIGQRNAESNVNKLLNEAASLSAIEKFLSGIGANANDTYVFDEPETISKLDTAQQELDAMRARSLAPSTDRFTAREKSLTVKVLSASDIEGIEASLAEIRRRKVAISDELLTLNMTKKITLSVEAIKLLQEFKLI